LTKIKDSFAILKNLVLEARANGGTKRLNDDEEDGSAKQRQHASEEALCKQIRDLKSQVLQRDTEINILVNMVKQGKTAQDVEGGGTRGDGNRGADADNKYFVEQETDNRRFLSSEKNNKNPTQSQSEMKLQNDRAKLIQRHLFGVPPPSDPLIFEDAAGNNLFPINSVIPHFLQRVLNGSRIGVI
jgi:hypothetical protein